MRHVLLRFDFHGRCPCRADPLNNRLLEPENIGRMFRSLSSHMHNGDTYIVLARAQGSETIIFAKRNMKHPHAVAGGLKASPPCSLTFHTLILGTLFWNFLDEVRVSSTRAYRKGASPGNDRMTPLRRSCAPDSWIAARTKQAHDPAPPRISQHHLRESLL